MQTLKTKTENYEFGIDLVRVAAMLMAIILHFYWENGFYFQPVKSISMILHAAIRDICFSSILLFMMLTGYLKCGKEQKPGYYRSLVPMFISVILVSLCCGVFRVTWGGEEWGIYDWFTQLTGFDMSSYSWYVNMYFGMFLVSPYINMAWNRVETKKGHQQMVFVVLLITCIANSVNTVITVLPSYWTYLWPFAYYLVGCYIKTYRPTIRARYGVLAVAGYGLLLVMMNMVTGGTEKFTTGHTPGYNSVFCIAMSTLVFVTLYQVRCRSSAITALVRHVAPMALEMILASYIFSALLYPQRGTQYGPEAYFVQGLWREALVVLGSYCIALPVSRFTGWLVNMDQGKWSRLGAKLKKLRSVLFLVLFAGAAAFLFWKSRYGFGNTDEAFYLSVPIRLCQGDALFVQEWHLSQLAGYLLMPLMWVYRLIFDTTDGILLNFRYIYVTVQVLAALFLYYRWRKTSRTGAFLAAISFMLFAPFGIGALSYNSMGILFMTLAATVLLTAERKQALQQVIAGVLLAAAVLCCPWLVIGYVVYCAAVVFAAVYARKKGAAVSPLLSPGCWLRLSAGCAIMLALLLAFMLSRSSISDILKAIPGIFNDPEHDMSGWFGRIRATLKGLFFKNKGAGWCSMLYLLTVIAAAADRKRAERRSRYWLTGCALVLGLFLCTVERTGLLNFITLPLSLLPILSLVLTENGTVRRIFAGMWIPGAIYGLCLVLTSNQLYLAAQLGLAVSCTGSILMIAVTIRELLDKPQENFSENARWTCLILSGVILLGVHLGTETYLRYRNVFWETGIEPQTVLLTEGPEAGLYVTESKQQLYEMARIDFSDIQTAVPDFDSVAILSENCWHYLLGNWENCAYSAWLSGVTDHTLGRLEQYYEISPHKLPDLILIDNSKEVDWQSFAEHLGYTDLGESYLFRVLQR